MEKKLILIFLSLLLLLGWLIFIGQIDGTSGIRGDINLIDEGQFGAWVNHMLHGKVMYKDFFPPYGPLQVYPLFVLVKIFGPSFFVIRFYTLILGVFFGICIALYTIKILRIKKLIAIPTIAFFVLYPSIHIRSWIVVLCIVLLVKSFKGNSVKGLFLTGVLAAYALLQSIEAGVFFMIILTGFILARIAKKTIVQQDVRKLLFFLLGFGSLLLIISIWGNREGWLFPYINSTFKFITNVSGVNLPNGQGLPDPLQGFRSLNFFSPFSIAKFVFSKNLLFYWSIVMFLIFQTILFIRFKTKEAKTEDLIVFLLICYTLMSYVSIIGRSGHHFLYSPFIVLFAGYFLSSLLPYPKNASVDKKIAGAIFYFLLLCYITRYVIIFRFTSFLDFSIGMDNKVARVAPLSITHKQSHDITILQQFISKTTKPEDTIFLLNNLPGIYFLVNRENATRYDFPLLAISKKNREELVESLKRNKPVYIIEDLTAWPVDEVTDRQRLPEVVTYINKTYIFLKKIDHYLIYKKR